MILPPSILRIRIVPKDGKRIGLWIPLFLLWPLIFVIAMLFPVIARCGSKYHKMAVAPKLMSGPQLWMTFVAARGTRVDVQDKDNQVLVALW